MTAITKKTVILVVELEYDPDLMHGDDQAGIEWFFFDILKKDTLHLHSNEIGDTIGEVRVICVNPDEVISFNTNLPEGVK